MKKLLLSLAVLFFSISFSYGQEDWQYKSQSLDIDVNVSSSAKILPTSSDYSISYISVNLSHFPYKSFNQEPAKLIYYPTDAQTENNTLLFRWEKPGSKIDFGYQAEIKTYNKIIEVKEKVPFPILELPEDLVQYTLPAEIIDSESKGIIELASQLAEGEDDLYIVVHKIAAWTKDNIQYNLSSLTEKVSQKASWVLEQKKGVCDELTSLFIAMLRSLGIPSKFVSGVAYTNSPLFTENWGSHGWAEVYFPGYGWVPFDVTYGQFGYIDPAHVKLKESIDSNEASVQYRWLARNIELDAGEIDVSASVEQKTGQVEESSDLGIIIHKKNVGFGSYNLVEALLANKNYYYLPIEVYISSPKEVKIIGEDIMSVLLKPNEKKSIFWMVKMDDFLPEGYIYTLPISVRILNGPKADASFISKKSDTSYSFEEINSMLHQKKEEDKKVYSRKVNIECSITPEEFYFYEKSEAGCRIRNEGNTVLKGLNVCFEINCSKSNLGILQEKSFNYSIRKTISGKHESLFKVENADVSKAAHIMYNILDQPKIKVKDIKTPGEVEYRDNFKAEFLLAKESESLPKNVKISLTNGKSTQTWSLESLPENRKIIVSMKGKELRKGNNPLKIDVDYEDNNGRKYESHAEFKIKLVNVTFFQSILLGLNRFAVFLDKAISKVIWVH